MIAAVLLSHWREAGEVLVVTDGPGEVMLSDAQSLPPTARLYTRVYVWVPVFLDHLHHPFICPLSQRASSSVFVSCFLSLPPHSPRSKVSLDTWLLRTAQPVCEFSLIHHIVSRALSPRVMFIKNGFLINNTETILNICVCIYESLWTRLSIWSRGHVTADQ